MLGALWQRPTQSLMFSFQFVLPAQWGWRIRVGTLRMCSMDTLSEAGKGQEWWWYSLVLAILSPPLKSRTAGGSPVGSREPPPHCSHPCRWPSAVKTLLWRPLQLGIRAWPVRREWWQGSQTTWRNRQNLSSGPQSFLFLCLSASIWFFSVSNLLPRQGLSPLKCTFENILDTQLPPPQFLKCGSCNYVMQSSFHGTLKLQKWQRRHLWGQKVGGRGGTDFLILFQFWQTDRQTRSV